MSSLLLYQFLVHSKQTATWQFLKLSSFSPLVQEIELKHVISDLGSTLSREYKHAVSYHSEGKVTACRRSITWLLHLTHIHNYCKLLDDLDHFYVKQTNVNDDELSYRTMCWKGGWVRLSYGNLMLQPLSGTFMWYC